MAVRRDLATVLQELRDGLPDDPDAQWRAAIALGEVQTPQDRQRAVDALLDVLTSRRAHALTRAHAVESLGRLGDRRAVGALLQALGDSYRLVRSYAASSLAALGDVTAIEPLLNTLGSDDFFGVRAEAARAVGILAARERPEVRERVAASLTRRRVAELAERGPGWERTLAEIDKALESLGRSQR